MRWREITRATNIDLCPFFGLIIGTVLLAEYRISARESKSTCPEAHRRCEDESETCRWHLSELQMKCPTDHRRCAREQCAKALGRFSRYVPKGMVESLMFCQCAIGDSECKRLQWMYPRCLYSYTRNRPRHSCTEIMVLCENDALCARQFKLYNNSCQISSTKQDIITQFSASLLASTPRCVAPKMDACRVALIGVRGSFLETPCFCENEDAECFARQAMILPNTPCIEAAMMDYATRNGATTSGERRRASKTRLVQPTRDAATETIQNDDRAGAEVTLMSNLEREDAEETDEENRDLMKEKYEIVDMEHDGSAPLQNRTNTSLDVMEIDLSEATESNITEELLHEDRGENFVGVMTTSSTMISLTDSSAKTSPATSVALVEKKATAARRRPPLTALRRAGAGGLPTGAYVTQRPPPAGGCSTRNIDGEWIVHYKDSLFRHYDDWSGRCSSWCECSKAERMKCHELGCLVDVHCEAPHATVGFGERLYLEGRGACQCQSGKFICDTSEESLDLAPGLYISLGYSKEELSLLKSKVPKIHLEKSGLVSPAASVAKDIASRLQFALERVLPKGTLCRITLLEHFQQESIIIYQVQYYGVNHFANETQPKWHIGRLEKLCAQYVQELAHNFLLEKVDRYQLVLSTVKQLRVIDSLNGLPFTATPASPAPSAGAILRLNVVLAATIFACSISIMGQFSP